MPPDPHMGADHKFDSVSKIVLGHAFDNMVCSSMGPGHLYFAETTHRNPTLDVPVSTSPLPRLPGI
jgi:hypothetical protein